MRSTPEQTDAATRAELESYYDAVPRLHARVEDFGPLSLFISANASLTYYGRPALGHDGAKVTASALQAVLARQRELDQPQSLEWVAETTPELEPQARAAGLIVHRHPLMVFGRPGTDQSGPTEITTRVLAPDDPALATAIAAAQLAFSEPGLAVGKTGLAELTIKTAELQRDGWLTTLAARMRAGLAVVVAAFDVDPKGSTVAVASGQHNPVAATTEIVGVGTLPSVRRRGLAYAVTQSLVTEARSRGIETIFLSAGDDQIARIYERIGFRRIGTALVAESPPKNC